MKQMFTTLLLGAAISASFSTAAFAANNKTKTAVKTDAPMTANSAGKLQREMHGMHVDMLPEVESSTKAIDDPDRIVCKKVSQTGSRLRKRKVCATKKEWDIAKQDSVNAVRQMQLTRSAVD